MANVLDKLHAIFTRRFGKGKLYDAKASGAYMCPKIACASRKKNQLKFSVTFRKRGGVFRCWTCGYTGVMRTLLEKEFSSDKAKDIRGLLELFEGPKKRDKRGVGLGLGDETQHFKPITMNDPSPTCSDAIAYLERRGLRYKLTRYYNMMYAAAGRCEGRVVLPSFSKDGRMEYYTARAIDENATRKYLNPQDVMSSEIIFNERFVDWTKRLIVVEGMMDYLKLHGHNRTCLLGSSLSRESKLFGEIVRRKTPVCFMLDTDADSKAEKMCSMLKSFGIDAVVDETSLRNAGLDDPGNIEIDDGIVLDKDGWIEADRSYVLGKRAREATNGLS